MSRRIVFKLLVCAILAGCAPNGSARDGSRVDRRSESEYDLARDAWLRGGDARQGLGHALNAVAIDDDNAEAHHLVALLYLDLCERSALDCRLAEAEQQARRAVEIRPDFAEAKNTLAVVLIHQKRPAEAEAILLPLTRDILYGTPEIAWGNLGWAYLEDGKLEAAAEALERSVAAQPRFCVGFYRLGLVHERKHQPEAALEAFTRALEADPRCAGLQDAVYGRARVELRLGRNSDAVADLQRCVALSTTTASGKECDSMLAKLK